MRLKISDNPYTAYQTMGNEKSDVWITFAVYGANIASMQFDIDNGVLYTAWFYWQLESKYIYA